MGKVTSDHWIKTTLGEVLKETISGSTPSRSDSDNFKGDILWITSGELNYNTIFDTKEKVSQSALENSNLRFVNPGTMLIAITGLEAEKTRGSCAIVGKKATMNQSCMALIPKNSLLTEYLFQYYLFNGERFAFKYCQGTKQQSYTADIVKGLPILLPSLHEQKKIAEILSTWDSAITMINELIKEHKKEKQALITEVYNRNLSMRIIDKSNYKKLSSQLNEVRTRNNLQNSIPVLSVSNNRGFIPQDEQFEREVASKNKNQYKIVSKGQFAYNPSRINVGSIDLLMKFNRGLISPMYVVFECKETLFNEYLYHYLKSDLFLSVIPRFTQGSVRDTLTFEALGSIKILVPSLNDQVHYASILNEIDKKTILLDEYKSELNKQKTGLMQQLLTGKIRVSV